MKGIKKAEILNGIDEDWLKILDIPELDVVIENLDKTCQIDQFCPSPNQFFEFAKLTPFDQLKVCILGMDPYPNPENAHGLAFSCLNGVPASLKNIYMAIENNGFSLQKPYIGNLSKWAKQGVLLLNTAFSTKIHISAAHLHIWKPYAEKLINKLQMHIQIWILWGNPAQEYAKIINPVKCKIFKWRHPSPLAQTCDDSLKFRNCDHFRLINEHLTMTGLSSIEWDPQDQKPSSNILKCENFFNCNNTKVVVFTDGGCHPNVKSPAAIGKYAAIFACGPFKGLLRGQLEKYDQTGYYASNIRAEGMAIIRVLQFLAISENKSKWTKCVIILDCEFWKNMIEQFMPSWNEAKFRKQANSDLTSLMWNLYQTHQKNASIELIHMKSHNKTGWKTHKIGTKERFMYEMNNLADKYCSVV